MACGFDTSFGLFDASGPQQVTESVPAFVGSRRVSVYRHRAPRLPESVCASSRCGIFARFIRQYRIAWRRWHVLCRPFAQNGWGGRVSGCPTIPSRPCGGIAPPRSSIRITTRRMQFTPPPASSTPSCQLECQRRLDTRDWYARYRRYDSPTFSVFRSDNRSSLQRVGVAPAGNVARRLSLVANYTLSSAKTWGCEIGELFDYVNGVCDPSMLCPWRLRSVWKDIRHRAVLAGTIHAAGGFDLTSCHKPKAPPHHLNNTCRDRAVKTGKKHPDQFRGTPYLQTDLRREPHIQVPRALDAHPSSNSSNLLIAATPVIISFRTFLPFHAGNDLAT